MPTLFHKVSIKSLIIAAMVITALVPIVLLAIHLHKNAWNNAWREVQEKHQLLAENMAAPIQIYINDHKNVLMMLNHSVMSSHDDKTAIQRQLNDSFLYLKDFASLTYVDHNGLPLAHVNRMGIKQADIKTFADKQCFTIIQKSKAPFVSGAKFSPIHGKPTIIIGIPTLNKAGQLQGILFGELRIEIIEQLRRKIRFGKKGHSAIVDRNGNVIAHPNSQWMKEIKNLAHIPVVKKMMQGDTGVTEFYSPFIRQDMVAGYATIPGLGWGVMVPQPKSEIAEYVNNLMLSNYAWGTTGLILAVLLAIAIARRITNPIHRLVRNSQTLIKRDFTGRVEFQDQTAPKEMKQLADAINQLVDGLQKSRAQFAELNLNLQDRVNQATMNLRLANEKLERAARSDYLTSIANRRFFENDLSRALANSKSGKDVICVLLIDVDNFKQINDRYGHAAGDYVLTQLATLLQQHMRPGDLAARYAGDEFVARLRCKPQVAIERANQLRSAIEAARLHWDRYEFSITVSVGIHHQIIHESLDVKQVMQRVDQAMYRAKHRGRNRVEEYS